ncbi:hypothetical protein [Spiroplasma cantharicola]|uniref:Uncharacterized protein n=1 Tax=Spiroplasma cantharicola TaxID=362837 RepID=A0A0M5KCH8_9MOLU|nr:hypothetical protein [Spiroplasma cantharicola]ALD66219.1 hypothetical protein SCANT_v1c03090 [Spiroplasma cantharicola]
MLEQLKNINNNNFALLKVVNNDNFVDFKDIIYNFLNQPQIRIEKKYDILFSQAFKINCFKKVVKELEKEFTKNYVLWKLTENISYWTSIFFSSKFSIGNGMIILQKIFILKQIFLVQLRYNSNIWLKLNKKQTEKIKPSKNLDNINYKLLLLFCDFNENEDLRSLITKEQKELLNLVLKSDKIEDYVELNNKIKINIFKYLPINIKLFQGEVTRLTSKLNKKEKAKLAYVTFMQLYCIFVEENYINKN